MAKTVYIAGLGFDWCLDGAVSNAIIQIMKF